MIQLGFSDAGTAAQPVRQTRRQLWTAVSQALTATAKAIGGGATKLPSGNSGIGE
jgi:hypothetical protein